jgi:hemerythrin-like domain-containing protein
MNRVTNVLRKEHRLIERAAACLDRVAEEALEGERLCVVTAIDLLEFFEDFVHAGHQEKEERHLFPALREQGLARRRVLELLDDHGHEREVLQAMGVDLEHATNDSDISRIDFACAAREFSALQREHAADEDLYLLPMVEELLDEEADRRVLEGFRRVDTTLTRTPQEFAILVENAAQRMGSIVTELYDPWELQLESTGRR